MGPHLSNRRPRLDGRNSAATSKRASLSTMSELLRRSKCEQAAAVCYRVRGKLIEFLLIRTRGGNRWTFPKGSTERGLTHAQAAAIEAFEEAGVHGRIEETSFASYATRKRGKLRSGRGGEWLIVNAHLCSISRLGRPREADREPTWFSPEKARTRLGQQRDEREAAELTLVIERALVRIQSVPRTEWKPRRVSVKALNWDYKDALRKVTIENAFGVGVRRGAFVPNAALRPLDVCENASPKLLQGDVLPFAHPAKALTGSQNRTRNQKN